MHKFVVALGVLLLLGVLPVGAQTPPVKRVASPYLAWAMTGPTLATVQGYTYRITVDAAAFDTVLPGVTCAPMIPGPDYWCLAPLPAFTATTHVLRLVSSSGARRSGPSATLVFAFVVAPAAGVDPWTLVSPPAVIP